MGSSGFLTIAILCPQLLFLNDSETSEKEDKILVHYEHGIPVIKVTVVTVMIVAETGN